MTKETGGPAYPRPGFYNEAGGDHDNRPQDGMTLRDAFAIATLPAAIKTLIDANEDDYNFLSKFYHSSSDRLVDIAAVMAYAQADAMLRARKE